jgi:hypothetical protein
MRESRNRYICVCMCIFFEVYIYIYICIYICMHIDTFIIDFPKRKSCNRYIYGYVSKYIYIYICIRIDTFISKSPYGTTKWENLATGIYVYVCVYILRCLYICIFIYVWEAFESLYRILNERISQQVYIWIYL